jgi:glycosyltransferase involved in cell wall biosynthesis
MRVALVGPYPLDPGQVAGGVEASFVNLVQGLALLDGLEPHVIAFVPPSGRAQEVDVAGTPVRYVPAPTRHNNLTLYRTQRRLLRRVLDELEPDVVHAQDALGYGYVCLRAAKREAVVISVHGIVRETRKSLTRPRDRLQVTLAGVAVEAYCVRRARYLVQPTRYPEEYFDGEVRGHIVDVGNGVQDRFFAVEPQPEPGRVLYAGAVTELKRVLDLVDAFARVRATVPGAALRIAGDAPDGDYLARVRGRVAEHGLEDDVTLLGRLRTDELLEEYRRASLFALVSGQETSPMVVAEAMAASVPIVATRVGGVPYLVDDGRTGVLVGVADVVALGDGIAGLLSDEPRRAELARAARRRAEERFRIADVAARVRAVYRDALDEKTARLG